MAAEGGLDAINSAETKLKERGLGKPYARRSEAEMDGRRPPSRGERSESKPLARFDEGEGNVCGSPPPCSLYSTLAGPLRFPEGFRLESTTHSTL
jgi:hypothetical protein